MHIAFIGMVHRLPVQQSDLSSYRYAYNICKVVNSRFYCTVYIGKPTTFISVLNISVKNSYTY